MLKLPITYEDFEGVEHTEDFYFNLSKGEIAELEVVHQGTFKDKLQAIIDANDGQTIIDTFKDLVNRAYGEKSEDGKHFYKSKDISKKFEYTAAYSEFFMKLVTDAGFATDFVNGVFPSAVVAEVQADRAASELARQRSEAALQGHLQPAPKSPFEVLPTPPIQHTEDRPPVTELDQPFVQPPMLPTETQLPEPSALGFHGQVAPVQSVPEYPTRREARLTDQPFTD